MKDEFYEYDNKQPQPTLKGVLIQMCIWGVAVGLFVIGGIVNGTISI